MRKYFIILPLFLSFPLSLSLSALSLSLSPHSLLPIFIIIITKYLEKFKAIFSFERIGRNKYVLNIYYFILSKYIYI